MCNGQKHTSKQLVMANLGAIVAPPNKIKNNTIKLVWISFYASEPHVNVKINVSRKIDKIVFKTISMVDPGSWFDTVS